MGRNSVWQEEELDYLGDRIVLDWESLMAGGTVPALILGAERRLHRKPSPDEPVRATLAADSVKP